VTTLNSERLTLRPVGADEMPDLVALWQNETFTRFIMGRALSEEEIWFRLLRDIGHWQIKGYGNWAVRETSSGAYVGSVGIFDYRRDMKPAFEAPELGWGIAPQFQGQGMATEAVATALKWADSQSGFSRTVCMISPDNAASVKLAARNGYHCYTKTDYKGSPVKLFERHRRICDVES